MNKQAHIAHSNVRIGISGWRYAPWRGEFYPKGLRQRQELYFASRSVNSIELNGSFYGTQTPERYANWYADTPDDFIFSIKAPRFITHIKRLRNIETPLANFFASGLFQLKEKLGPILWQFPPRFKYDESLFRAFLSLLPFDSSAAKRLAKNCDASMEKPGYLDIPPKKSLRHAVEIRNQSFVDPEFVALLREFNVALVVADTAGKWPYLEELTSDFSYIRLHGDQELYVGGYDEPALNWWCKRIGLWQRGEQPKDAQVIDAGDDAKGRKNKADSERVQTHKMRDIYCYFDNDVKVRAPFDARRLLEKLHLEDGLKFTPGVFPESLKKKS